MIFFRVDGIVDRWIVSYRNLAILPNRLYLLSTLSREKWVARPNKNVIIILFCWKINSCSEKNLASTNFVHCVHFHLSIAVPYLQNFFSKLFLFLVYEWMVSLSILTLIKRDISDIVTLQDVRWFSYRNYWSYFLTIYHVREWETQ